MHYTGGNNIATDPARGIFQVARRAFTSDDILEAERRQIFDKCWLYVGHESEVAAPGAFVARSVGGRDLIFNRDAKGVVHAFLDACPHRGAKLCQERKGVAKNFQCIYHGWVFSADGKFRRQPHHAGYPADFESCGSVDLVAVPRLESYRGLWFACFDRDAQPLADYLGGAREYIDCMADQSDQLEIISGSQEYMIRANWKLLCENSFDGYHADNLHATYFDYVRNIMPGAPKDAPPPRLDGVSRDLGNGHAVVEFSAPWGRPAGKWSPAWGEASRPEMEGIFGQLVSRVGEQRANRIAHKNRNLLIFPNLLIIDAAGLVLRTMYPEEPGRMTVSSWAVAPQGESEWLRKLRLRNFLEFLGPGGLATPDDIEALERCQRGYRNIKEAAWNDISKGDLGAAELPLEDEGQIRAFWKQWGARLDADGQAPEPPPRSLRA
jgi:p-cumate 2,3-dioxygenase alpha subunit